MSLLEAKNGLGPGEPNGIHSAAESTGPAVVIVDPFSSGKLLLGEFYTRRIPIIGVLSSQELAGFWLAQWEKLQGKFVRAIEHVTLEDTLSQIREHEVFNVIPGSEPGVPLAEALAGRLGLPCNCAATSAYRHNKFEMQERLRQCGLRAIKQVYSADLDEVQNFCIHDCGFPVIVKPAESGGTDGVNWCHSPDDVTAAFHQLIGAANVNGFVNDRVLVQEYLEGTEYVVNCVSHGGQHLVTCMWVYDKKKDPANTSITYLSSTIMESSGDIQEQLRTYVFKCLDALGVQEGASHNEVMMTRSGPCLIEVGARLHGLLGPRLTELATGIGPHEVLADVICGAKLFARLGGQQYRYNVKKFAAHVLLLNQSAEGVLEQSLDRPEFRALASTLEVQTSVKVGQHLVITRDMATSPGVIFQLHPSLEQCKADELKIRELEASSLYRVRSVSRELALHHPGSPAAPSPTLPSKHSSTSNAPSGSPTATPTHSRAAFAGL